MPAKPKSMEEVLTRSERLPTLPAIALRILEVARKDNATIGEMERVISVDPPLAAKVLHVINSPFYSLPNKVTSVRQAISMLGINAIKHLALGFSLVKLTSGKGTVFDHTSFWKQSMISATSSKILADGLTGITPEESFFMGLLQDIGILAINGALPKQYAAVLALHQHRQDPLERVEREMLGFDHAEAGAFLIKKWGLPPIFLAPIRYHHEPHVLSDPVYQPLAYLLSASAAVGIFYSEEQPLEALDYLREYLKSRNMTDELEQIMIRAFSEAVDVGTLLEVSMGRQKNYVEILEEANYELGRTSLRLQKTVVEQARQNEELREQVSKDGLTGLYNYRSFQDLLDRELDRSMRYWRPMGLILGDLDKFKDINDTYGHQMGDKVLVELAQVFKEGVRKSDFAARYGGEEFAIVLVETSLENTLATAERLRDKISRIVVSEGDQKVRVTISFGLTAVEQHQQCPVTKQELIRLADEALYEAKRTGRNRCCARQFHPHRIVSLQQSFPERICQ